MINEYIFTSNIPANQIRKIGRTGFDVISLIGFELPDGMFEEPVIDHCFKKNGKWITGLDKYEQINCTKRKVTIYGNENGMLIYKLHFGNQKNRPFMFLTIYSRIKNKKDNIENLNVEDVWTYLESINDEMYKKFGIRLNYSKSKIRIKEAEINKTFPINDKYSDYYRILKLMSYILGQTKKGVRRNKIGEFKSQNKYGTNVETNYLLLGKTIKVTAYNKGVEVSDEDGKNIEYYYEQDLMRIEIKCLEQNLTSVKEDKTSSHVYLYEMNDENVASFFNNYFLAAFKSIEAYLIDNYANVQSNLSCEERSLYKNAVLFALRTNAPALAENLLINMYIKERETEVATFLDIDEYMIFISFVSEQIGCGSDLVNQFEIIKNDTNSYNAICQEFVGQRKRLDCLREKITREHVFSAVFTKSYDGGPICFILENKNETVWDKERELYITNNYEGLVYRIETYYEESLPRFAPEIVETTYIKKEFLSYDEYIAIEKEHEKESKKIYEDNRRELEEKQDYKRRLEVYKKNPHEFSDK